MGTLLEQVTLTPDGEPPVTDARQVFGDRYPTPMERDYHAPGPAANRENGHMLTLSTLVQKILPMADLNVDGKTIARPPFTTGELNPDWEEWLMCWPLGWTDLETPLHRLYWLNPSNDPAKDGWLSRTTTRKKNRVDRVKVLGNGQFPPTAAVMLEWGMLMLARR